MKKKNEIPGVEGSTLEVLVTQGERLQRSHDILFGGLLLTLAALTTGLSWTTTSIMWGFLLLDWGLLTLLPHLKISYGPAKPPALLLAILRIPFMFVPHPWNWVLQAIGTLLVIYAFFFEPQSMVVTREYLITSKFRTGEKLRILHFGDLHIERLTAREDKVLKAARSLQPDLILFSGDILSFSNVDDALARSEAQSFFVQLSHVARVFAVAGSPPVDRKYVLEFVYDGSDVMLLDLEQVNIDHPRGSLTLTGIPCTHNPEHDGEALGRLNPPRLDVFNILLYHTPDLAPKAAALGYDLQLSGHTHGGQVRLPFFGALYTSSLLGKRYESGRYQVGDMDLYVTRGLGMEGKAAPRVRFLCPPEIVLWEISGQQS